MASITSNNAVLLISVAGIFSAPQQMQGFSAEDIYDIDDMTPAETLMGLDGKLSGGFVYVPTLQKITLQADSASNAFFDNWFTQQKAQGEVFPATGLLRLPSIGYNWSMTRGFLTTYKPAPPGKKVLMPRTFGITWESCLPALI